MTHKISGTPVAFISVSDRERALTFYRDVLGFELRSSDGALLRIAALPEYRASPHPVPGWNVHDIVATVQSIRARGVEFTVYEGLSQDELGIWAAPDGQSRVACFADPDSNVLSVSQA